MIAPAAYILLVPKVRRQVLLDYYEEPGMFSSTRAAAEPVPRFEHSRRAPLIVFCSFKSRQITHVADGRKGAAAGSGLVRLNLERVFASCGGGGRGVGAGQARGCAGTAEP